MDGCVLRAEWIWAHDLQIQANGNQDLYFLSFFLFSFDHLEIRATGQEIAFSVLSATLPKLIKGNKELFIDSQMNCCANCLFRPFF